MTMPLPEPPPSYPVWEGRHPYGHVYWAWCNYHIPWDRKYPAWDGWPAQPGEGDDDKGPLWHGEMPNIEHLAQEAIEAAIGPALPAIRLQPANALINFPMIASTEDRGPLTVALDWPTGATVTGTPAYEWIFEDGGDVGHGPGLPYDGTSPRQHPDYYVDHTYRALGRPELRLTVTWQVLLRVPGDPAVRLNDVVRSATATTTVRTAMSELIGG